MVEFQNPQMDNEQSDGQLTPKQADNIIIDTVVGPNLRLWDNLIQAAAILVSILVGAGVGALVAKDAMTGAIFGGIIGMIAGLLLSGIALMIFRAMMHSKGKHD